MSTCPIIAIDPGNTQSGYCVIDRSTLRPLEFGKIDNAELLQKLSSAGVQGWRWAVIEMVASYGMSVGRDVFDTTVWIGRFYQVLSDQCPVRMLCRIEEKKHICHDSRANDTTIRRRIKLLELNHDNFKKAEQRGATLSDFVELNKIEDLDARNRVLETLGTANFNREMQNALSDQKYQHRKAEWIEQLRQFAVENPDANYSTHTHVAGYGYWNTSKDVEVPDDADSVAYCYKVSQNQIDLYKERDLEKENAETAKREEKRQQEQFYKDQLAALTNYMFELRRDFVTQLSTAECKKHLGEIVRFAVDAFDSNYDGELTIKLLGVAPPETDGVDLLDYLESTSVFSDQPEKALLSLAYSAADDGSNGYWGWVWKPDYQSGGYGWEENGRLDAIYTLLVALGYEMSDEEKALQNGTHAIFSTNAPKKADAPCDRCKAAHPNCDKCCKACDEPCNAVQDCKKNEERTENDE